MDQIFSRRIAVGAFLALVPLKAFAQFTLPGQAGDLLKKLPSGVTKGNMGASALSQGDISAALKDAMKVASRQVIGQVGKPDGFAGDPAIRIPLPGPLQKISDPLRAIGASGMLDDLALRMNRGAEQAAPQALDIFVNAASNMSFDDARGILTGPQDGVTQYFKRTTGDSLTTSFHPIVSTALSGAGAMRALTSVQAKASTIPFVGQSASGFDLAGFTVGKALDGIFHYLAVQEAAIRSNPAARSTDLLKKIFA
jgi:hypothetical protein